MQNLAWSTPPLSVFFHGCSPYTSEDLVYHLRPPPPSADVFLISLCHHTFNTFLDVNHIIGSLVDENRCKQNYAFIQVRMFSASIYSNLPLTAVIFLVGIVICSPIKCTMHL